MKDNTDLLDFDAEDFKDKLFLANLKGNEQPAPTNNYKTSIPKPGFCIKTTNDKEEKVFINICTCSDIPCPKSLTDEECIKLLETMEPNGFRVPLSLGDPHVEADKSGKGCVAYDVAVNPVFFEEMMRREILKRFFLIMAFDGLENKHNILINRDFLILKNRKSVGSPMQVNIRTESKPWILEVEGDDSGIGTKTEVQRTTKEEAKSRGAKPEFKIIQEPQEGYPNYLVADIHLPKVKMASSLTLDIGEDRLVLATRSNTYYLDIYLPFPLDQDNSSAQFNRKTNVLTLVMPVIPSQDSR